MPLQFGRSGFIKLGEESSYGVAASLTVDSRIVSSSLAAVSYTHLTLPTSLAV